VEAGLFGKNPRSRLRPLGGILAALALPIVLTGCTVSDFPDIVLQDLALSGGSTASYAQVQDGGFTIPAVPPGKVDPKYLRQSVRTPTRIRAEPGTIVVDPANRYLYLVQANGRSMRYGIGVGRQGFSWSGEAVIKNKQKWPMWFPPVEMQARDPEAAKYPNGMEAGLQNPLGARALYLFQGNRDTLYRLHGTNDPSSIGKAVSSGCVRLMNQDIIDLYERVPTGTRVVVLDAPGFKLPDLPDLPNIVLPDIFGPRPAAANAAVPPSNVGQI
jgi:lipoprotein-anchoring transpeptidase ErfK/SrfK